MADSIPPSPNQRVATRCGSVFAGYEIERELGRGGNGVVYLARQVKLNRRVGLKMLLGHYGPDDLMRFVAEAQTAAGLHHNNIADIFEVGEHEGAPFYSMEYAEGGSLADRLREGTLLLRDGVELLIQIARSLHFAHQNGIVHRDLKPANILVDRDGVPKVADFTMAKRLREETKLTRSGMVIGTPTYMAPEQAKGNSRQIGPAADVYALGTILYEMLAGRPPFLPEDSETVLTLRVVTEDPVSPAWHQPGIPRDLETICIKCLEKQPRNRYRSAAALAEDLRRYLDDEPIQARPPTSTTRVVKWVRRHPWEFVAAAALCILVGAVGWRSFRWEFYQRPFRQYAAEIDYRFGTPEPLARISATDAHHRDTSLRFTRRGRWGPVTRVELINARSQPANSFFNSLANWMEGGFGLEETIKSSGQIASIDFSYENKDVLEQIARDRNNLLTWHLIYDRTSSTSQHPVHARYVTPRGFDSASRGGASVIEFERDGFGRDVKASFFSGSGEPAPNDEGVYAYFLQRDPAGHLVRVVNLGQAGTPIENAAGYVAFVFTRNAGGFIRRIEFRDGNDKPAPRRGMLAVEIEYDASDNITRVTHVDDQNRPINFGDWATLEFVRNKQGEIAAQQFFRVDETGKLVLSSRRVSNVMRQNSQPVKQGTN